MCHRTLVTCLIAAWCPVLRSTEPRRRPRSSSDTFSFGKGHGCQVVTRLTMAITSLGLAMWNNYVLQPAGLAVLERRPWGRQYAGPEADGGGARGRPTGAGSHVTIPAAVTACPQSPAAGPLWLPRTLVQGVSACPGSPSDGQSRREASSSSRRTRLQEAFFAFVTRAESRLWQSQSRALRGTSPRSSPEPGPRSGFNWASALHLLSILSAHGRRCGLALRGQLVSRPRFAGARVCGAH